MEKSPLISILIPTYRRPDLLKRNLDCLLVAIREELPLWEVIISDDSRDPSFNAEIVELFRSLWKGKFSYHLHEQSLGQQKNFNFLIVEATGTFIQFVHDDDFLLPDAGKILLEVARQKDSRNIPHKMGIKLVDLEGQKLRMEKPPGTQVLSEQAGLAAMIGDSSYIRFPSMFLTREMYINAGLFEPEWGYIADQALWFKIVAKHGLKTHSSSTVAYTVHEGAGTSTMFSCDFVEKLHGLLSQFAPLSGQPPGKQRKLIARFLWKFGLAGAWRSFKGSNWATLKERVRMIQASRLNEYPCPLKWRPLFGFFKTMAMLPLK